MKRSSSRAFTIFWKRKRKVQLYYMSIHFNPISILTVSQGTVHISHSSTLPSHTLIKRESCSVLEFSFGKKEKKKERK